MKNRLQAASMIIAAGVLLIAMARADAGCVVRQPEVPSMATADEPGRAGAPSPEGIVNLGDGRTKRWRNGKTGTSTTVL